MKDKKEKKKWGLILFMIFIMIGTTFSFVFFGFQPQREAVKYNEIKFIKNTAQNIWIAKIDGKDAAFSFLPSEMEGIFASGDFSKILQGKFEIDVTYDLNNTYAQSIALAQHQTGLTLAQYNIFVRKGFTANNTFNLPVIKCEDATLNVPVVYFRQGNTTSIHAENNCVIVSASNNAGFIQAKDRLLYGILGVIK